MKIFKDDTVRDATPEEEAEILAAQAASVRPPNSADLNAERDRLNIEWGRLQLEQSSWSTLSVVEQDARSRLGMAIPRADDIRMVTP